MVSGIKIFETGKLPLRLYLPSTKFGTGYGGFINQYALREGYVFVYLSKDSPKFTRFEVRPQ
jgi:hypothetical protein